MAIYIYMYDGWNSCSEVSYDQDNLQAVSILKLRHGIVADISEVAHAEDSAIRELHALPLPSILYVLLLGTYYNN